MGDEDVARERVQFRLPSEVFLPFLAPGMGRSQGTARKGVPLPCVAVWESVPGAEHAAASERGEPREGEKGEAETRRRGSAGARQTFPPEEVGSLLCGRERTRGGTWHSSVHARSITGLLKLQRYANTASIEVLPVGNAHTHVHKHGHTTPRDPCTPMCTRGTMLSLLSPSSFGSRSWKH